MRLLAPGWAGDGAISAQPSAGSTPPPPGLTHSSTLGPSCSTGALSQKMLALPYCQILLRVLWAKKQMRQSKRTMRKPQTMATAWRRGREEGEGEALGSPRPGRAGVWLPNPSLRLNGERSPPLPNTPSFGWAVGQPLPGAQWALESFWPSPSSGRGFGFLVGTGQAQLSGSCPPPQHLGPREQGPCPWGCRCTGVPTSQISAAARNLGLKRDRSGPR